MRKTLFILSILAVSGFMLHAQSIERKVIASGGGTYDSPSLSVSYTFGETFVSTLANAGMMLTQGFQQSYSSNFTMKMYIQGYYAGSGRMEPVLYNEGVSPDTGMVDSVTVSLIDPATYVVVSQTKGSLSCSGFLTSTFPEKILGHGYYIKINHRNLIETWSASPVEFSLNTLYDFSVANSKAYQDPYNTNPQMIQVEPGVWAMYNGDVNQDGTIDALDFNDMEADANAFNFGYYVTDITNSGPVDALDFNQLEANSGLFLFVAHP